MRINILIGLVGKVIASVGLGTVVLGYVAIHCGASGCIACVHVSRPDVDVVIDDVVFHHVTTMWDSPVECELRPGRHKLQMKHDSRVVYEESFSLAAGEQTVRVAWDQSDEKPPTAAQPTVLTRLNDATPSRPSFP
jgi:hypothetical protein